MTDVDALIRRKPYSIPEPEKTGLLLDGLARLTRYHYDNCLPYRRIVDGYWGGLHAASMDELPYLPVSIFKKQALHSVPIADIRLTLTSSGTTGQSVSKILIDKETSILQQKALASSLMHVMGPKRLPMLIIDTEAVLKDPKMMSARGAGVLGQMRFGRNHVFALRPDLSPDRDAIAGFLERHGNEPFFLFGFTFMVWLRFHDQLKEDGLDLSNGTLLHSGGWKKMIERSVDNETFRNALARAFGLKRIFNFYGMVEQIGSILLEGPGGLLYPPNMTDIIIRDPDTWQVQPPGEPGVVQLLSLLPQSYPGHSLLTEDLGVIEAVDPGTDGWMGKGLRILGRVPKAELRGCSDVIASEVA